MQIFNTASKLLNKKGETFFIRVKQDNNGTFTFTNTVNGEVEKGLPYNVAICNYHRALYIGQTTLGLKVIASGQFPADSKKHSEHFLKQEKENQLKLDL